MDELKIKLYTVVFIFYGDKVLLLKRASWKKFGAGKITGIGGHIEPDEMMDIPSSAFRELEEETKIKRENLKNVKYLGVLSFSEPANGHGEGHTYFFSADLKRGDVSLECNEGELNWYPLREALKLDFWEDTKKAFSYLLKAKRSGKIFRGNYVFNKRRNCFSYLME